MASGKIAPCAHVLTSWPRLLDLCLAFMPGAFVFDAADSVETVQRQRLHDTDAPVRAVVRDPRDVVTVAYRVPTRRAVDLDTTVSSWMPLRIGADVRAWRLSSRRAPKTPTSLLLA